MSEETLATLPVFKKNRQLIQRVYFSVKFYRCIRKRATGDEYLLCTSATVFYLRKKKGKKSHRGGRLPLSARFILPSKSDPRGPCLVNNACQSFPIHHMTRSVPSDSMQNASWEDRFDGFAQRSSFRFGACDHLTYDFLLCLLIFQCIV